MSGKMEDTMGSSEDSTGGMMQESENKIFLLLFSSSVDFNQFKVFRFKCERLVEFSLQFLVSDDMSGKIEDSVASSEDTVNSMMNQSQEEIFFCFFFIRSQGSQFLVEFCEFSDLVFLSLSIFASYSIDEQANR